MFKHDFQTKQWLFPQMTEIRRHITEDDTSPLLDESTIPIEDDEESETRYFQPQGTILSSVINITNTILGSGMLAMVIGN
jgi:hypothetical protein